MSTSHELSTPARGHLVALLAGEPCAGAIIDTMDGEDVEAIALHPEVTWKILAAQPDRDAALRLLEHRVQAALVAGDPDLVRAELGAPELLRDVTSERALEEIALRAVTALAWEEPALALALYQKLVTHDPAPHMADVYDTCHEILTLAPLWQELEATRPVPRPLARFVRLQWVASQPILDQLITSLRRDMTGRSDVYLATFDVMAARYQGLLIHIVGLTERFAPGSPPSLGELGEDERRRLSVALGEIDAPISRGVRLVHLLLGALTVGALISLSGSDAAALGVVGVLVAVAFGYTAWVERGMYGRLVRPPLAAYLAESGMPTGCVVSWLLTNRGAVKKIKAFDVAIDADPALAAIARLGRMTRRHAELLTSS